MDEKEREILKFWRERKIFEQSLQKPAPNGEFVFYEGPPTANGLPGIHHLAARAFKDLIPRYKTMRGYHVRRRAGWDTHGLPVELETEKQLGLKSKKDIEAYGIAAFNQKCRESVWRYLEEWQKFSERIGYWLDQESAYVTYHNSYIETLWWIFGQINERGLLYRDYKVVPWCPRCGTVLSSHELAQGYAEVEDTAVYVKFKVKDPEAHGLPPKTFLLAWTTTPWTLPGNVALAVGEKVDYVLLAVGDEHLVVARKLAGARSSDLLAKGSARPLPQPVSAEQLIGLKYEPLFNLPLLQNNKSHRVYAADFVNTEEGTGIVHTAVMYGPDDFALGTREGLPKHHLVDETGRFTAEAGALAGHSVVDSKTNEQIVSDLGDKIFKTEKCRHAYPFCWRCKTRLIYYARDSWYIKMSALRDELLVANEQINWQPPHLKEGRFGEWLREVKDWAISRERYWGTPLPVWLNGDGKRLVLSSVAELKQRSKKSGNKYWVLRHGEAENNAKRVLSSQADNPHHLTENGRKQVQVVAVELKKLKIDLIVASDFVRTRETADILLSALGLKAEQLVYDPRLREVNHGDFNGQDLRNYFSYYANLAERFTKNLPRGENFSEIRRRMGETLYELEQKYRAKNILIISHESPLWLLTAAAWGADRAEAIQLRGDSGRDFIGNAELRPLDFVPLPHNADYELDLHRPYIDEVVLIKDGQEYRRVPEVVDVWFDSGAMPFAQDHYPFENQAWVEGAGYPADYIAEAVDQTRGWFYTLLAISTLLGWPAPYKNVVSLGHLLDKQGKKMSKSLGNAVDPWEMIAKYGADSLRFWFYAVSQPGDSKNFDEQTVKEIAQKTANLLFNSLEFYRLYAPKEMVVNSRASHVLDRWMLARLNQAAGEVTDYLERYQITEAARTLRELVLDLSQWYLRRSRERLKQDAAAAGIFRRVLGELAKLLAPLAPFWAEIIWQTVRQADEPESIHLAEWPATFPLEPEILETMSEVRRLSSAALEARQALGLKIRQPLAGLKIGVELPPECLAVLAEELNVKKVEVDKTLGKNITLDATLTPELVAEGERRELIRELQDLRKTSGWRPDESAVLMVQTDMLGREFLAQHRQALMRAVKLSEIRPVADLADSAAVTWRLGNKNFTWSLRRD